MLGYCPLASGSRGNSTYVGTARTKVLIDAGLSAKATLERLASINVAIEDIDAIVISHEHIDHIQGIKTLSSKYQIPILANSETAKGIIAHFSECPRFKIFTTGEDFTFGDITFHPFTIQHDTFDPVAFTLRFDSIKLGVCTDLGFATTLVQHHLQDCDYLILEANHEPDMVHASRRHPRLKQRILGRSGHLSNSDCGALLCKIASPRLKHTHLAHLSAECNTAEKALSVVGERLQEAGISLTIDIAHQETPSHPIHF
jgi:phosphoribosyl 1,2-cyclic phosphodiesterase